MWYKTLGNRNLSSIAFANVPARSHENWIANFWTMTQLSLSLFGPFRASLDGRPVSGFASNRERALLAYLAVEAEKLHHRDKLAGLFWPEWPQKAGRDNLRYCLSHLRKAIGDRQANPAYLKISRDTIQFNTSSNANVDALTFTMLMENLSPPLSDLEEAVALYCGEFLEGLALKDSIAFDEWTLIKREQLNRQMLIALHLLASSYEERGQFGRALPHVWRQIELDPYQEAAHRQLMRLLALDGQRAAALAQYEACQEILLQDLGIEPDQETTALYQRIQSGEIGSVVTLIGDGGLSMTSPAYQAAQRLRHNLPRQTRPIVGREDELAELDRLLGDPLQPLITILGPGGIGKSRLAIEAAGRQLDKFPDGAYLVELAALTDPIGIPSAIAEATGFQLTDRGEPRQQILDYLGNKNMLLILDNFEHLNAAGKLVSEILQAASQVTLLVTSRQRLNLSSETVLTLGNLAYPQPENIQDIPHFAAVQLFLQCAKRTRSDFNVKKTEHAELARICRSVGGIPLGILLAAGWVDALSLEEIASEIARNIDFLESELVDLPERQRSMRAAFDSTWNLLGEAERAALVKMSVFRGGCMRKAAEAVTNTTLRMLTRLVNKSLLQRDAESGRFEMHELLRHYTRERLDQSGETSLVKDQHAIYYLQALANREANIKGGDQRKALNAIESDFENIRAAWIWAIERQKSDWLDMAMECLYLFLKIRPAYNDERLFLRALETLAPGAGEQPNLAHGRLLARFIWLKQDDADDRQRAEHALAILQRDEDQAEVAFGWMSLAHVLMNSDRFDEATAILEKTLESFEELGDLYYQGLSAHYLGYSLTYLNHEDEAFLATQKAYQLMHQSGDKITLATVLGNLAYHHYLRGDLAENRRYREEAIALARELNNKTAWVFNLVQLAGMEMAEGHVEKALTMTQEAHTLASESNDPFTIGISQAALGTAACIDGNYRRASEVLYESVERLKANPSVLAYTQAILAMALCGIGQYDQAREQIRKSISILHAIGDRVGLPSPMLPAAILLGERGKKERAAELLGLLMTRPIRPLGWLGTDPQCTRFQANLEADLGAEAFRAAWQRGENLDLTQTSQELLEQISD
jgi:DNA-binding SARP family transcriptional activator/predicted ATPase/Flp pilus assembly protein TadD